jgi:hypothetical protein
MNRLVDRVVRRIEDRSESRPSPRGAAPAAAGWSPRPYCRPVRSLVIPLALLLLTAPPSGYAAGQQRGHLVVVPVTPLAGPARCGSAPTYAGPEWRLLLEARMRGGEEAKQTLSELVASLTARAAADPRSVDTQFVLAAALGAQADVEGGRSKIRAAGALHQQLGVVLALDPGHAGAQHLLGRLHAAVRRMDSVTRWVATRLLGGGAFADASWAEARALLEAAVLADPCVPDHHYELARLYVERGQPAAALDRLDQLLSLPDDDPVYGHVFDRGRVLLRALEERRGRDGR